MVPNPVPLTPRFVHKEKKGVKFTTTGLIRKWLTFTKGVGREGREEGSDKSLTEILSKARQVNPLLLPGLRRKLVAAFDCFGLARGGSSKTISQENLRMFLSFLSTIFLNIPFSSRTLLKTIMIGKRTGKN